jgi:phosphoribosylamine-glycine ligase
MEKPENKIKTWVTLTFDATGMGIAHHLLQEGNDSVIGQAQSKKELKEKNDEKPEDKEKRLKLFDGIVKKYPARKLVDALKKVKNKDEYFIYCDRNNLWPYAEELLKAGFTKGIFPSQKDFEMEKEREEAMKFVEENYPDVKIIPHQKYATVEEAKKAVEESEVPLVIQSEGDFVSTVVGPDDVEQSKQIILSAMEKHAAQYKKGEVIIKEKLIQPVEITPQIVFWNGEPVYTTIDIETKNIGDAENNGPQVGCGTNLIISTDLEEEINKIAFPPKVYEMAKEHTGLFVFDISLYFTEKGIYFGEFCSNRFGYDSLQTEMTMAHGPSEYFGKIMEGVNPIPHFKFGTAVRAFNIKESEDEEIAIQNWKPVWLYDAHMKDDKIMSVGECWDLAVVTGRGNTIEEAVENVYDNYGGLVFKEKYCRSKADFIADYPTSIIRRFKATNGKYFSAPDLADKEEDLEGHAKDIKELQQKVVAGLEGVEQLHEAIKGITTTKKGIASKIKEKLYGGQT